MFGRKKHSVARTTAQPHAPSSLNQPGPTNITIQIPAGVAGGQPVTVSTDQRHAGATHSGFAPSGQTFTTDEGHHRTFGEQANGFHNPPVGATGMAGSSVTGAGTGAGVNRRVSVGDKMMGKLEASMGKMTGDRKMVADGQRRQIGGKAAVREANRTMPGAY